MSLLGNPVIQGLLGGGGPNAIRAQAMQQQAQLTPRGGGGMMGAPSPIVTQDRSMSELGSGLSGLGEGLASIGKAREKAKQREAFEAAIAGLPEEQRVAAMLNPEAFAKAQAESMFRKPDQLTTSNTALFNVDGKPKRMTLAKGIESGLPEWQDPPGLKTFGSDAVGYYGIQQMPDGSVKKIPLAHGLGRADKTPTYKIAETGEGVFAINSADPEDRVRLGDPVLKPQDELAAHKLTEEKKNARALAISHYEDVGNVIRQAEIILSHPGRAGGTGMSRALFAPFGVTIPGSDTAGFDAQLETLKAKVFLPEVQKMQGMGALSNAEGQKISAAFAALDPNMGDAEFERTLRTAISDLERARQRAKERLPADYTAAGAGQSDLNVLVDKYAGTE